MRYWLAIVVVFSTLVNVAYAAASTPEDARNFVNSVGKNVVGIINSQGMPEPQQQEKLQQLFMENVDISWMGRFALGQSWQKANQSQRDNFLQAYKDYLLARYTTNFRDYSGSKYTITDIRKQGDDEYVVAMDITAPKQSDQQDIKAGYRVHADNGGQLKISDIIIEGVSLINTERADFGSILRNQGIDALTDTLRTKTSSAEDYDKSQYFMAIIYTEAAL